MGPDMQAAVIQMEEAAKKKWITINAKSLGGHSGKSLSVKIKNHTANFISLMIPSGSRFKSEAAEYQDLIVTKAELIAIQGLGEEIVLLNSFCCEANDRSPSNDLSYTYLGRTDSSLSKLCRFINKNNFEEQAVQNAIWVLSNNHPINNIYSADKNSETQLTEFLCKMKGIQKPWYRVEYKNSDSIAFSEAPLNIHAEFNFLLTTNGMVTMILQDASGKNVVVLMKEQPFNKGEYDFGFKLKASAMPKGKYYARLYASDQKLYERVIEL